MVGHADLVEAADGRCWLALLGTRPQARLTPLGRETLLAPAAWDARGWLVVNGGLALRPQMTVSGLPPPKPWPAEPPRDDFDRAALGMEWNFLRSSATGLWTLTERPGWLRLKGSTTTLVDPATPAFLGRRQTALQQRAATLIDFSPLAAGQEAGLVLRRDEDHHVRLRVVGTDGVRRAVLFTRLGGHERVQARSGQDLPPGPLRLQVQAHADRYEFAVAAAGAAPQPLGSVPVAALSLPNSFTGHYFGVYASGPAAMPPADFDWFEIT
jgi:alpha-N-arabinofuranosidase